MKYLTNENLPTIECCNIEYTWLEREDECLLCGEMFDWEDAEGHWDPDLLDQWRAENGVGLEEDDEDDGSWTKPHHSHSGKKPSLDEDEDGWVERSLYADPQVKFFDDAYKGTQGFLAFKEAKNRVASEYYVPTGKFPTERELRPDVFLDHEMPNEVL